MTIWTIELNLNDDPLNSCSWHIDDLKTTCLRNIRHSIHEEKVDKWVLVGLKESEEIPFEEADMLRRLIAKERLRNGLDNELRETYGIETLLFDNAKEHNGLV
jgi:hypothetical protein